MIATDSHNSAQYACIHKVTYNMLDHKYISEVYISFLESARGCEDFGFLHYQFVQLFDRTNEDVDMSDKKKMKLELVKHLVMNEI
jgi:hypothetical protein